MTNSPTAPRLSIIMPVYNVEAYLAEAIESVIAQTYRDWELIVVDDGSSDGSGAIADRYAASDARIKVIHQKNGGVAVARNEALENATGKLIGFVDSDDYIEPAMFELMVECMDKNDADMVQCGYRFEWRNRHKVKLPGYQMPTVNHDEVMKELLLNRKTESYLWDKLFKREIITTALPEKVEYCEDLNVMHHWVDNIKRMATVEQPLYHYRMRRSSAINKQAAAPRIGRLEIEIKRAEYYRKKNINGVTEEMLASVVVSSALGAAKFISRNCDETVAMESFEKIINLSEPWFAKISTDKNFNQKQRRRFLRLKQHKRWYRITMKAGKMFQPSRLRKESDRFE